MLSDKVIRDIYRDAELAEIEDAPVTGRNLYVRIEDARNAGLRAVANATAKNALEEAAKTALNDWADGRVRGRLWHEWLIRRAASIPTTTKESGND